MRTMQSTVPFLLAISSILPSPSHSFFHPSSSVTIPSTLVYAHSRSRPSQFAKLDEEDALEDLTPIPESNSEPLDPIYILPLAAVIGVLLLATMVVYIQSTRPMSGIDVDLYMAIDDTLSRRNGGTMGDPESIVALPTLSPAEQLVGALFGPPSPR